jgi:DNA helicase-4
MQWKRTICQQHALTLIETYSYQFRPEVVFDHLSQQLSAHGVTLRTRSEAECLDVLRGSAIVTDTAQLFAGLIPIIREHGVGRVEIGRRIASVPEHERGRAQLLWELLRPIVDGYERHLAETGEVDFADMIRRATELVRSGQYRSPFMHLMVDEFQDISAPRAELILALARSRPGSSLFCVGDDWQSIYRFAGSDIRYISQFETLVGPGATTQLDRTFRFNDQIGRVASQFVTRNPAQVRKRIESVAVVDGPAVSLVPTAEPHRGLDAILRRLNDWGGRKGERFSVFVLARYGYELEELEAHFRARDHSALPHLSTVEFRTVHGVKGREADFVIVAGLEAGRSGFPADKPTDPFHEMFLPPKEGFEFADERRLFYVALTRAQHRVYLLFDAVSHSPFVRELRQGGYPIAQREFSANFVEAVLPIVPCPRCATGEVRPRSGPGGTFFGCHRYPACRYTERGCGSCGGLMLRVGDYCVCRNPSCEGVHLACPKCGAPMEHRNGPYGAFFGCSNFGRVDLIEQCAATEKLRKLPAADELRGR